MESLGSASGSACRGAAGWATLWVVSRIRSAPKPGAPGRANKACPAGERLALRAADLLPPTVANDGSAPSQD